MTLEPSKTNPARAQLPVEWRDGTGSLPVVFFRRRALRVRIQNRHAVWGLKPSSRFDFTKGFGHAAHRGFTILELLIVVAIIGFLASVALPHLKGFTKSNNMSVATRQLLEDVQFARQKAIANRSTVYMVFVPPEFWTNSQFKGALPHGSTNLIAGQYRGYALVTLRSLGDQPGRPHLTYLTDWKTLPTGVFIPTNQFLAITNFVRTTNTLANADNPAQGINIFQLPPYPRITFPFPSTAPDSVILPLPCIAFSPRGSLEAANDQFIPLTSGGIIFPTDNDGNPTKDPAIISETVAGDWTNNANLIHIDRLTARPKVEHNTF